MWLDGREGRAAELFGLWRHLGRQFSVPGPPSRFPPNTINLDPTYMFPITQFNSCEYAGPG